MDAAKCYIGSAYGSGCITVSRHGTCEIMMCQDDESDAAESTRKGIEINEDAVAVAVANACLDKKTGKNRRLSALLSTKERLPEVILQ
jgi:hypothetical protein